MKKPTKIFLLIFSVLVVFGIFLTVFVYILLRTSVGDELIPDIGDKVALIELVGEIKSSEEIVKQFKEYRENRTVKAITFRVESPGGGVVASQEIYEEVRKTREVGIPVVVSMGSVAASGGYYVSCGASTIVANPGTITGSIGVISQFLRLDPMLDKVGIKTTTIKSGKFKDAGSMFREMTKEDKMYFQKLMNEVHLQFITVVKTERDISLDEVTMLADGRIFTGAEAKKIGLVDTLGTYEDAISIAAKLGGIEGKPVVIKKKKKKYSLFELLFDYSKITDLAALKDEILNSPMLQYKMVYEF